MLNYAIILGLCAAGCFVVAWLLFALLLGRAGRRVVTVEEGMPADPGSGSTLTYARADLVVPLLVRRPWLAIGPIYVVSVLPLVVMSFPIAYWRDTFLPTMASLGPIAVVELVAYSVLFGMLAMRAVGRPAPGAVPVGASWRVRRAVWGLLAWLVVGALGLGAIELEARWTLLRLKADFVAGRKAIAPAAVPQKQDGAYWYGQAVDAYAKLDTPRGWKASSRIAPAGLSADAQEVVRLLWLAGECESADFLRYPMPQGGSGLLQMADLLSIDAATLAQSGNWAQAVRDVAALQAMVRHCSQSNHLIAVLIAVIRDAAADDTLQVVASCATTEQELSLLPLQQRDWYPRLAKQWQGVLDLEVQWTVIEQGELGRGPGKHIPSNLLGRWILLHPDLDRVNRCREQMAQIPIPDWGMAGRLSKRPPTPVARTTIVIPQFTSAGDDVLACFVRREVDDVGLAVVRYRIRNGRLPVSLDEVVKAGLLPAAPQSPWDGTPMSYSVTGNQAVISASNYSKPAPFSVYLGKPPWLQPTTKPASEVATPR